MLPMTDTPPANESVLRLLLVADTEAESQRWLDALAPTACQSQRVNSGTALRAALQGGTWDAVLAAFKLSRFSAAGALRGLAELHLDIPLIVLCEPDQAAAAFPLMAGAARDVVSSDQLARLPAVLARETAEARRHADHRAALSMLDESEARLRALASNIPGMVFQLQRGAAGDRFLFISEGCGPLLGLRQHELMASPRRFFLRFVPEHRPDLEKAFADSAGGSPLYWEGRIRRDGGGKWVSVRCQARRLPDGDTLWQGIVSDITHSKEVEAALLASRTQLSELSSHLEAVKEEERERIARDIHDELGSTLVAIKIEATLLAGKLPKEPPSLRAKARSIEGMLDQAMGTASRVARELRPGILKEFGLPAAIECQAEDFSQRTGVACKVKCDDYFVGMDAGDPDDATSLALFRIVQETLTNVAKHAHASLVAVRLSRERDTIALEIRDNGRGISDDDMSKAKSFGLRGIRERVNSLGGTFEIAPGEKGGTRILLRVPCSAPPEPASSIEEPQGNLF
jgi:two-component system sensor histidine kinase UhpB